MYVFIKELRQAFVDMGYMRNVLMNERASVLDKQNAPDIETISPRNGPSTIEFKNVSFSYENATEFLLHVSITVFTTILVT